MVLENLTLLEALLIGVVSACLLFVGIVQMIAIRNLGKLCALAREDVLWTMDEIQEEHSKISTELRDLKSVIMDHSESMAAFVYFEENIEPEEDEDE